MTYSTARNTSMPTPSDFTIPIATSWKEFRVGDKIKRIKGNRPDLGIEIGMIFTIKEFTVFGGGAYVEEIDGVNFSLDNFELYRERKKSGFSQFIQRIEK